ncbi:hypothetical protein CDN98_15185 [Roseateles terrae]|nr:hypothetical protein CDN98_15185 [Roseateles terrae]
MHGEGLCQHRLHFDQVRAAEVGADQEHPPVADPVGAQAVKPGPHPHAVTVGQVLAQKRREPDEVVATPPVLGPPAGQGPALPRSRRAVGQGLPHPRCASLILLRITVASGPVAARHRFDSEHHVFSVAGAGTASIHQENRRFEEGPRAIHH